MQHRRTQWRQLERPPPPGVQEGVFEKMADIKRTGYQMGLAWFHVPGHPLATPIFDWADTHDLPLMVMLHYGWEPRMVFDQYAENPTLWLEKNTKRARLWAEKMQGHPSIRGVILGNETSPHIGTAKFISRWPAPASDTVKKLAADERHLGAEEESATKSTNPKTGVVPATGTPSAFWRIIIRKELADQYGNDIAALNRNWRTRFANFEEIDIPAADSGGWSDLRHIGRKHFAIIMDTLIRDGFKPILGNSVYYNSKHSRPDPFTWRACKEYTAAGWDDVEALFPLWAIKAAADTTPLPLFNSEFHLYHDTYNYRGSPEISRYRYLTSALLGEYWTASFQHGKWTKPAVAANHAQTPAVLRDLEKSQRYFRALARAYQNADLNVLLTEENWFASAESTGLYGTGGTGDFDPTQLNYNELRDLLRRKSGGNFTDGNPFAEVYARMAMTGNPWRYYMENDLTGLKDGTLVVWSPLLKPETARALAALPDEVRLIFVDAVPTLDIYRQPLPAGLLKTLTARGEIKKMNLLETAFKPSPIMRSEYQKFTQLRYWKFKRPEGKVAYDVPCAQLEVRSAETPEGHLVAILNNTDKNLSAPMPWSNGNYLATDLLTGGELSASAARKEQTFGPFAVRLFRLNSVR